MKVVLLLTILGGFIAASSAMAALVQVGADPAYQSRNVFGWVALACAALATGSPVIISRPTMAALILFIGGIAGGIAINMFYINTFYLAALPLWWVAALLLCLKSGNADRIG